MLRDRIMIDCDERVMMYTLETKLKENNLSIRGYSLFLFSYCSSFSDLVCTEFLYSPDDSHLAISINLALSAMYEAK